MICLPSACVRIWLSQVNLSCTAWRGCSFGTRKDRWVQRDGGSWECCNRKLECCNHKLVRCWVLAKRRNKGIWEESESKGTRGNVKDTRVQKTVGEIRCMRRILTRGLYGTLSYLYRYLSWGKPKVLFLQFVSATFHSLLLLLCVLLKGCAGSDVFWVTRTSLRRFIADLVKACGYGRGYLPKSCWFAVFTPSIWRAASGTSAELWCFWVWCGIICFWISSLRWRRSNLPLARQFALLFSQIQSLEQDDRGGY